MPSIFVKCFFWSLKNFCGNEDSEAIIKMEIIPKIILMRAYGTHTLKS